MYVRISIFLLLLLLNACHNSNVSAGKSEGNNDTAINHGNLATPDTVYRSTDLLVVRLAAHTYQHISYLQTNDYGRVDCNGMLVVKDKEVVIFDTPADEKGSIELIKYVHKVLGAKIKAVIPTHFHKDCIGGLEVFHRNKIPIYASLRTVNLVNTAGTRIPALQGSFADSLALDIAGSKVVAQFYGEGHTKDNVIGYFPLDGVMFGGCLLKTMNATKGNLDDANTAAWSNTIIEIERAFPTVKIILPGHGSSGGKALITYTEKLFRN